MYYAISPTPPKPPRFVSRVADRRAEYLACKPRGGPGEQARCCTHACTNTAAVKHGYNLSRLARQAPTSLPAVVGVLLIETVASVRRQDRHWGLRREEPRPGPAFKVRRAIASAGRSAPFPLSVCRRRCHVCCHLLAAGTVRQAVPPTAASTTTHRRHCRHQHICRPLSLPARRSPQPWPRLLPSLPQWVWLGKRDRRPPLRAPSSLPALRSPQGLPRLLLALCSGDG